MQISNLNEQNKALLSRILQEANYSDRDYFDKLSDHEAKYVLEILREYSDKGYSQLHNTLWEIDFTEKPVSIQKFISDPDYLGVLGRTIYPTWHDELGIVLGENSKILEWIISGSIGIGKTTISNVAQAYKAYKLMCLRNPQEYYEMMEAGVSTIGIAFFNITIDLAYKVTYSKFQGVLQSSPWFRERIKPNRNDSFVELTNGIGIILGSRVTHALGSDTVGGSMDETDFSTSVDNKQVKEAYNALDKRIGSRYTKFIYREAPGIMTLISSTVQDAESFLNLRMKNALSHPETVHVSCFPHWKVKPSDEEIKSYFYVFLGDNLNLPKIISPSEVLEYQEESLVEVPDIRFYREKFEDDLDRTILDYAGVRMGTKENLFLRNVDKLKECLDGRQIGHPFSGETLYVTIHNAENIQAAFKKDLFIKHYLGLNKFAPIINPSAGRFIHVDLAKNGDAAGFAMVHCSGHIQRDIPTEAGSVKRYKVPTFYLDFALEIKSQKNSEIDFDKIRDFIYYLNAQGVKIDGVSFDGYQSVDSLQLLKKSGLFDEKRVITLSVEAPEPYASFRNLIMEGRISMYNNSVLIGQIPKLLRDPDTGKVDHPKGGSKDISDAVCGAIEHCQRYHTQQDLGQIRGPLLNSTDYITNREVKNNVNEMDEDSFTKI